MSYSPRQFWLKYSSYIQIPLYVAAAAITAATYGWIASIPWFILVLIEITGKQQGRLLDIYWGLVQKGITRQASFLTVFPPGEIADKVSILSLKQRKIGITEESQRQLQEAQELLDFALTSMITNQEDNEYIDLLLRDLGKINEEQWEWENRVRAEQTPTGGWTAALGARECNNRRVAVKNQINKICGAPTERKAYAQKN